MKPGLRPSAGVIPAPEPRVRCLRHHETGEFGLVTGDFGPRIGQAPDFVV